LLQLLVLLLSRRKVTRHIADLRFKMFA